MATANFALEKLGDPTFFQENRLEAHSDHEYFRNEEEMVRGVSGFCRSLKRIVIPEGVTEIGESAFSGCKALEEVVLPSTLRKIGCRAFSECQSLASIALPEGLEEIGDEAFYLCKSLTQADIPSSVTKIGEDVFAFSGVR